VEACAECNVQLGPELEIENFFATYKLLEEKETDLRGWDDASAARLVIRDARGRYDRRQQVVKSLPTGGE
jgi:inorganic pyrophosphatase